MIVPPSFALLKHLYIKNDCNVIARHIVNTTTCFLEKCNKAEGFWKLQDTFGLFGAKFRQKLEL
jgi:hypothetical protein